MTQYLRPASDISATNWTNSYTTIDEVSYDDADFLQGANSANGTTEKGLSSVTDPASSSGHIVRFRAWQQNNTKQRTLSVVLVQGSTTISTYAAFNLVKGTATSYNWTLSAGEADSITNYADLRLRFTSAGDVGTPPAQRSLVYVSWAEMEVPGYTTITKQLANATIAATPKTITPRADKIILLGSATLSATGKTLLSDRTILLDNSSIISSAQSATLIKGAVSILLDNLLLLVSGQASSISVGEVSILFSTSEILVQILDLILYTYDISMSFGEETPTGGELGISWQTWKDEEGSDVEIVGDGDWGAVKIISVSGEISSLVYDLGNTDSKTIILGLNEYGTGVGSSLLEIRGDSSSFERNAVTPTWESYTIPVDENWRYLQLKIKAAG